MLIQVKNQILRIESISFAEIIFPDADSTNDWIELRLIIDGASTILYSDEAVTVWHTLQRNATGLAPVNLNGHTDNEALAAWENFPVPSGQHWWSNSAVIPQIPSSEH